MPTVEVNGIDLYYEIEGDGPPLTMIMGLACTHRQWQWMAPILARSFKVITFDNRGVGKSGKPDIEYTTDMFAADIAGLLNHLNIEKTHIFGISVGGMIAQRFAYNHREMLDRLVLGCTMAGFFHMPLADDDLEKLQTSSTLPTEEGVDMMIDLFLTDDFIKKEPDHYRKLKEIMMLEKEEQGTEAFFLQLGAAMNHDTIEQTGTIDAPTLVLVGDKDPMAPIENSRFLAETIPNSKLVTFPGVRHGFWVEAYKEASKTITAFLSEK